jgi:sugar phosphate isomerase/epimerase
MEIKGGDILRLAEEWGADSIELEYRISEKIYRQVLNSLSGSSVQVLSLHNFCYRPGIIPPEKADADYFRLSSTDTDERQRAVEYTIKTVEHADEIGASYVVLHLGDTGQEKEKEFFRGLISDMDGAEESDRKKLRRYKEERGKRAGEMIDQVYRSLDKICEEALRYGITLGIENRFYLYQFPSFDEMGDIFSRFTGAPLGLWLDTGHAAAQEKLGQPGLDDYLSVYREKIEGFHLHDIKGSNDHQVPGSGEIDFGKLAEPVKESGAGIIELHGRHTRDEIRESLRFIRELVSHYP